MTDRFTQIGFSQRIRLEWLEQTANLILAGTHRQAVSEALQALLHDKLSVGGHAERGNREKAITILMQIWVTVQPELSCLRDIGLELLQQLPLKEHIAVHWGMTMAAYPFFGSVAGSTGRLLRLQGTASAAQVQRRVKEKYGARDTVSRAARRVLRTFVDWGVLAESSTSGVYVPGQVLVATNNELAVWLMEAVLHTIPNNTSPLQAVIEAPSLFPLTLAPLPATALAASGRIEIIRHSLDHDLVMLRPPDESKACKRGTLR
jgi:hypothetical protein